MLLLSVVFQFVGNVLKIFFAVVSYIFSLNFRKEIVFIFFLNCFYATLELSRYLRTYEIAQLPPLVSRLQNLSWKWFLNLDTKKQDGSHRLLAVQLRICHPDLRVQLDHAHVFRDQGRSCKKEIRRQVPQHVQRQRSRVQLHPESPPEHPGGVPPVAGVPDHRCTCVSIGGRHTRSYLGYEQVFLCLGVLHWRSCQENAGRLRLHRIPGSHRSVRVCRSAVAGSFLKKAEE